MLGFAYTVMTYLRLDFTMPYLRLDNDDDGVMVMMMVMYV